MKSGLVSIAISLASGASRSRIGRVKVPTPGPYSTNNLAADQSTGFSILSIRIRLDGMTDPTITGCLRKPAQELPASGSCARGRRGGHGGACHSADWLEWRSRRLQKSCEQSQALANQPPLARRLGGYRTPSGQPMCDEMQLCARQAARCRKRPHHPAFPLALRRHAGRRGGQHRACSRSCRQSAGKSASPISG